MSEWRKDLSRSMRHFIKVVLPQLTQFEGMTPLVLEGDRHPFALLADRTGLDIAMVQDDRIVSFIASRQQPDCFDYGTLTIRVARSPPRLAPWTSRALAITPCRPSC